MKGFTKVLLAVGLLAAIGCNNNKGGGNGVAQVPVVGGAGLNGTRPDGNMPLARLNNSAYFQVVQNISLDLSGYMNYGGRDGFQGKNQRNQRNDRSRVVPFYFDANGGQGDVNGNGFDQQKFRGGQQRPQNQSRFKVCSLTVDSEMVYNLIRAGQRVLTIPVGTQLQIQRVIPTGGQGSNGEVNFDLVGNPAGIRNIGCDKMQVQAFENRIFRGALQVFIR